MNTSPYRAALDAGLSGNAIRYVLEGRPPKFNRAVEICQALGLELRIGPPGAVPEPITAALGLPAEATVDDVLTAIEERTASAGTRPARSAASPPSAPDPAAGLVPVTDRGLAELIALLADEWDAANAHGREGLVARFRHAFPELSGGGHRHRALWRGSGGG